MLSKDLPSMWNHALPITLLFSGLYIVLRSDDPIPYELIFFLTCTFLSIVLTVGIELRLVYRYRYYYYIDTHESDAKKPSHDTNVSRETVKSYPNLSAPLYEQSMELPKMNNERHVAITLCRQHDGGLPVNMTEQYWLVEKRFKESRRRWILMLDNWAAHGLIEKPVRGEKRVLDWDRMRLLAGGSPLPLHPSLLPKER